MDRFESSLPSRRRPKNLATLFSFLAGAPKHCWKPRREGVPSCARASDFDSNLLPVPNVRSRMSRRAHCQP